MVWRASLWWVCIQLYSPRSWGVPFFGCPAEDRGWGSHDKDASWRLLAIIWRGATILAAPAWRFLLFTKDDLKLRHAVPPESAAGPRMSICLFYSSWLAWTCFWIFFSAYLQVGRHWQPSLKILCLRQEIWKHHQALLIKHYNMCVHKS